MKSYKYIVLALLLPFAIVSNAQNEDKTLKDVLTEALNDNTYGYTVTAKLIQAVGLMEQLGNTEDMEYLQAKESGRIQDLPNHPSEHKPGYLPEHRYIGYTLFYVPDTWWVEKLGKQLNDITVEDVAQYVLSNNLVSSSAANNQDYTSLDNALNQFVTYHILPAKIERDKLVIHFNELWYNVTDKVKTASVFDYYTTMGKRRLLKTYEASKTYGDRRQNVIWLNRFPVLDNGPHGNYTELACDADKQGVEIYEGEKVFTNGIMYPVSGVLSCSEEAMDNWAFERMRMDFTTLLPELMTNDIRCNPNDDDQSLRKGFPVDAEYKYLDNCIIKPGTRLYYLTGRKGKTYSWHNYQGDELNAVGQYDVTFTLPPVPRDGTYELRIGISSAQNRGICKVYFGTDPENLRPIGLPLDMRRGLMYWNLGSGIVESNIGYEDDDPNDDLANRHTDMLLKSQGYMKAPNSYYKVGNSITMRSEVSTYYSIGRRVLCKYHLQKDEKYYIRFANVLDDESSQLYLDYIEICPKIVYDNPNAEEDIW